MSKRNRRTPPAATGGPKPVRRKGPPPVDHNPRPPTPAANLRNWRHGDTATRQTLEHTARQLTDLAATMPHDLDRIRDAQPGHPAAARTDTDRTNGSANRLWCDRHESDRCTEVDTAGQAVPCSTLLSRPHRSDPTGEAGIHPTPASQAERDYHRGVRAIATATDTLAALVARHDTRTATAAERRDVEGANTRWCESCLRADDPNTLRPRQATPRNQQRTDIAGRLDRPRDLCGSCYDWICDTVPAAAALALNTAIPVDTLDHKLRTGKWRRQYQGSLRPASGAL